MSPQMAAPCGTLNGDRKCSTSSKPEAETSAARRPLEGRTAIVTGSTSGIGLGIARALAQSGAAVMLNGFGDPAEIEAQRAALADENDVDVAYDSADMSNRDAIHMMVERAVARFGQVDIVVNNAGIQHVAPIGEFPVAKWDAILAINLSAAFHLIQATFEPMRKRGYGRIINVASAHGLIASPFKSAYVAAKHGMIGLDQGGGAGGRGRSASPRTRSAPAMSGRRWSRSRSTTRPSRTASPATR